MNEIMNGKPKGFPKAAVEFYSTVLTSALLDLADMYNVPKQESQRDIEEIRCRVDNEGMPFLTVSLPKLGKALDRALSCEGTMLEIHGFQKKPGSVLPKFLGWYWSRVFDDTGRELPDSCPLSVKALRQLVYLLYKLEIPPSKQACDKVAREFVEVDSMLPRPEDSEFSHLPKETLAWLTSARAIATMVMRDFDPHDVKPRHGPGAVATGEKNHKKHCFKRIYSSIEREYPFTEYFMLGMSHVADRYPEMQRSLKALENGTAKVVLVPKDSRGPRLISCEPLEYQWIQQGLGNAIRDHVETRGNIAFGQVNFTDQGVNRKLALLGSQGLPWVTLDMKEASDRVSVALVKYLFGARTDVLNCLLATRTTATKLPSGDVHVMNKFAPMGSNLCFPIESIVFYVLAVAAIVHKQEFPMHNRCKAAHASRTFLSSVREASRHVYVYGDDIVCRTEDYQVLLSALPIVGLLFNKDKCCTHGSFRESCGMDAFKGVQVQPLRLKKLWSVHRKQDALTYASYVAFSNAAYVRGYHRVADFISQHVERDLGALPVKGMPTTMTPEQFQPPSGLVLVRLGSRVTAQPPNVKTRYNRELHRYEVRCRLPRISTIEIHTDDWSMVLRRLLSPGLDDLGIFPMAHRVTLKWAWIRAGG